MRFFFCFIFSSSITCKVYYTQQYVIYLVIISLRLSELKPCDGGSGREKITSLYVRILCLTVRARVFVLLSTTNISPHLHLYLYTNISNLCNQTTPHTNLMPSPALLLVWTCMEYKTLYTRSHKHAQTKTYQKKKKKKLNKFSFFN